MKTPTIYPSNTENDTATRIIPDALHVEYKFTDEVDETDYRISSPDMIKHIDEAIK